MSFNYWKASLRRDRQPIKPGFFFFCYYFFLLFIPSEVGACKLRPLDRLSAPGAHSLGRTRAPNVLYLESENEKKLDFRQSSDFIPSMISSTGRGLRVGRRKMGLNAVCRHGGSWYSHQKRGFCSVCLRGNRKRR